MPKQKTSNFCSDFLFTCLCFTITFLLHKSGCVSSDSFTPMSDSMSLTRMSDEVIELVKYPRNGKQQIRNFSCIEVYLCTHLLGQFFREQSPKASSGCDPNFWLETHHMDPEGIIDESTWESLTEATQSAIETENEQKFVLKKLYRKPSFFLFARRSNSDGSREVSPGDSTSSMNEINEIRTNRYSHVIVQQQF